MVIGGIVLIVLAALWLLRGIPFVLTANDPLTTGGGIAGLILGALVLTAGIVLLKRGMARREPS